MALRGLAAIGRFHGWYVVGACFMMAIVIWTFGFYGQGIYVHHFVAEVGLPVGAVSSVITGYLVLGALLVPASGRWVDRVGPRIATSVGAACLLAGCLVLGRAHSVTMLIPGLLLLAFAWATMSLSSITVIIGGWFDRRRGTALSLALNGASVGGMVGVPALALAVETWGFATGLLVAAIAFLAVLLPVTLWAFIRDPAAIGQRPDGALAVQNHDRPVDPPVARAVTDTRSIRVVTLAFALGFIAQTGFLVHQLPMLSARMSPLEASWAVSLTALCAILGRLVSGPLLDRHSRHAIAGANFFVQVLAIVVFVVWPDATGGFVASAIYGLTVGNLITLPSLVTQHLVRTADFAATVRRMLTICQVSGAVGPATIGLLRAMEHGDVLALALVGMLNAVAGLVVWISRSIVRH